LYPYESSTTIGLLELHRITEFFPLLDLNIGLIPRLSRNSLAGPLLPESQPSKTEKFAILQKYNRVNLVVPLDAPHMWHAAIGSKSCKLTVLGEHYRKLVEQKLI
jgi:hypothetical protein